MTITDPTGATLYAGVIDRQNGPRRRALIVIARDSQTEQMQNARAIGV